MGNRSFVLGFIVVLLGLLGMNSIFIVTEMERAVLLEAAEPGKGHGDKAATWRDKLGSGK